MNKLRNIAVIGGGTFQPIRNHLALAAPAFGTTATKINVLLSVFFCCSSVQSLMK